MLRLTLALSVLLSAPAFATQYQTNANFSTDATGTAAYADGGVNSTKITGYTALSPTGSAATFRTSTITSGGTIGADFVRLADGGWGNISQILTQNGPGNIVANTQTQILAHVRINALATAGDTPIGPYLRWSVVAPDGYTLAATTTGAVELIFWTNTTAGAAIGSAIAKSVAAGTWYWERVGVSTTGVWEWKFWSGAFSSEPVGWDVSGVTDTTSTSGYVGPAAILAQGTPNTMPVDFDWFSSATGVDTAPGPSGGACTNSGYQPNPGVIGVPNGTSGTYLLCNGSTGTPNCSSVTYYQPSGKCAVN